MLVCSRELLAANRTYYVRTDGNDNNTGLTNDAAGAFLTINKAVSVVFNTLDLGGFNVTIQVGDGTYSAGSGIAGEQTGRGSIIVQGNVSTPANVVISATGTNCFTVASGASLFLRDMELRTSTNGLCVSVVTRGFCGFQNLRFGASATGHVGIFGTGSQVQVTGDYAIVGSTPAHFNINNGAYLEVRGRTITLSGTPNWATAFVYLQGCATCLADGNTFTGGATGKRFQADANSVIQTFGASATYLPGNVAGTTATGGQYT